MYVDFFVVKVGIFDMEFVYEFLWKLVFEVWMNLYVIVYYGINIYYIIEVVFKVFGCVFDEVIIIDLCVKGILLMKGML